MGKAFCVCIWLCLINVLGTAATTDSLKFTIRGNIDTVPFSKYLIGYRDGERWVEDSLFIDENRRFVYSAKISEPTRFFINVKNDYNLPIIGDYNLYEFWISPGDDVEFFGGAFKIDLKRSMEYEVLNSSLEDDSRDYYQQYESFLIDWRAKRTQVNPQNFTKSYIGSHLDSYFSLHLLYFLLKGDPQEMRYVNSIINCFNKKLQTTTLYGKILLMLKFGIGAKFPDFVLLDTNGKLCQLSDLQDENNYLLIDFWASWCVPCRRENRALLQTWAKYKSHGFDVLGISLDNNEVDWKSAILEDMLPWRNLSDLKGVNHGISKEFGITAIPTNFLLDNKGTILARDLRGKALDSALENLILKDLPIPKKDELDDE